MNISNKLWYALMAMLVLWVGQAVADNDGALYDPVVAADEGLVRVLNLHNSAASVKLETQAGSKGLGSAVPVGKFSDYVRVKVGAATVKSTLDTGESELDATLSVQSGGFYTVILHGTETIVLEDAKIARKGKALVNVYNFSNTTDIALKTANGKTPIIKSVKHGTNGYRQINAISLNMGVFTGDQKLVETGKLSLRKDQVMNIVITGPTTDTKITTEFSTTNTRI